MEVRAALNEGTGDGLGMSDILAILAVTDAFSVDREHVSISLDKAEQGIVRRLPSGDLEVVAPKGLDVASWLPSLREALRALGYVASDDDA